jgi:hypothetical protein
MHVDLMYFYITYDKTISLAIKTVLFLIKPIQLFKQFLIHTIIRINILIFF